MPSLGRRMLLRLAVGALGVVGSLLVAEAALRIRYHEEEVNGNYWGRGAFTSSAAVGYVHTPGYDGHAMRRGVFRVPVTIDELGLRQPKLARQLAYPTTALVLGDSFAFGLGVREEEGFVARVRSTLNEEGIGVVNGGQVGFAVEQERRFGLSLMERIEPEVVVLALFAANDVLADFRKEHERIDVAFGYRLRKDRSLPIAPVDALRTHSYLWMFLENVRQTRRRAGRERRGHRRREPRTGARIRTLIGPTLAALTSLRDHCRDTGVAFGVVMIPARGRPGELERHLRTALEQTGTPTLDLGVARLGPDDYLVGDDHWNARGHAKAAAPVAAFIRRLAGERAGARRRP